MSEVHLTDDERAQMNCGCHPRLTRGHADTCFVPVVEFIVAARTADLRRWKSEAIEVIYGLQELGKALDLPLGERITGPKAVEAVQALTDERDELRKVIEGEPWLADLVAARAELAAANARCAELEAKSEAFRGLSESWHRMYEGAEALNADIRQRALALADQWDRDLGKAFNPHGDELRAALTPEGKP